MSRQPTTKASLGINGLGRIGKLSVWHHVARRYFGRLVVNVGRDVGTDLNALCAVIEKDSSYGAMHRFLHGVNAKPCIRILDSEKNLLEVDGIPLTILNQARNPKDIAWREHGVRIVVDTTGAFCDPTLPIDHARGALRGHLAAGAEKVINSAAFKIKDKALATPDDAITLIYGINEQAFNLTGHNLISAASCTTTALAHMVKPILDELHVSNVMTASMSTIHAATNTQSVLDTVPKAGASDLRKSRSVLNNIILTSTNAANALEKVIPQIKEVGFMADSVRIPIPTESLIILNITFQSQITKSGDSTIDQSVLNGVYQSAAEGAQKDLLVFSKQQNVPSDLSGMKAAVVIEGTETHTRTGFATVDLAQVGNIDASLLSHLPTTLIQVPVTHAKIFGWYDNEYGSYTNMLGELTEHLYHALE
jgi:glyceraldehyde 3-phosphate dehydrogenase